MIKMRMQQPELSQLYRKSTYKPQTRNTDKNRGKGSTTERRLACVTPVHKPNKLNQYQNNARTQTLSFKKLLGVAAGAIK